MPYQKLFPPELRTASIVPRWSVVWTLNKDTVANHSYFVTFYARQIAKLIGWKGSYEDLMYYALVHDLDETVTGDIVSPVKAAIVDKQASDVYVDNHMSRTMPDVLANTARIMDPFNEDQSGKFDEPSDIKLIVKAADRLDALLFLITEERLGNSIIMKRTPDAQSLLRQAWMDLPGIDEAGKKFTYEVMLEEISHHRSGGGFGV